MAKRLGADKEIEKTARTYAKKGWEIGITGGNHIKWKAPDGTVLISGLTGCGPGWLKVAKQLAKTQKEIERVGLHT